MNMLIPNEKYTKQYYERISKRPLILEPMKDYGSFTTSSNNNIIIYPHHFCVFVKVEDTERTYHLEATFDDIGKAFAYIKRHHLFVEGSSVQENEIEMSFSIHFNCNKYKAKH